MFERKPKRVYVLGAGPAGLLAAHAADSKGYPVTIFSAPDDKGRAIKSPLYGCQYLHQSIPGLPTERRWVHYRLDGSIDGYRRKVYGQGYNGSVSPDEFGPEKPHAAFNLREAYNELWDRWSSRIVPTELNSANASTLFEDSYAAVLTTIPAPALCRDMDNHKFVSQEVWAMGSAPGRSLPYVAPEDTVLCNGHDAPRWYRAATVFGYSTMEWPGGTRPPISEIARVSKPLSTDCGCWLGKHHHRLGRFGKWQKGVLVHTAYFETLAALP